MRIEYVNANRKRIAMTSKFAAPSNAASSTKKPRWKQHGASRIYVAGESPLAVEDRARQGARADQAGEWDQPENEHLEQLGSGQFAHQLADREDATKHSLRFRLDDQSAHQDRNLIHDREDNPDLYGTPVIEQGERFR
jgi:hypothetical protein